VLNPVDAPRRRRDESRRGTLKRAPRGARYNSRGGQAEIRFPVPCIRLSHISKRFVGSGGPASQALEGVSFEVGQREVVTIVGPSGCGKSTLLRIVAGLESPSEGTVEIQGKVVDSTPARERNIAMVFQSYALYPHMTCFENLALNLKLKKTPQREIEQRVQETARLLEIGDLLHKRPRELSGGQRQRVAVGRALIRQPEAFLFDEPLSNLDAMLRERVRHELKELFRKIEATVVYVTHDQVEAMTLADRVVVLDRGRTQQIGTPEQLYRCPANRFVASFIGSPSMNLFESRLSAGEFSIGSSAVRTSLDWSGEAVVGVRPEHVVLGETGIPAKVKWVENLGAQYLVGIEAGAVALSVTDARRPASDTVHFKIEPENLHVFEKSSGANLTLGRARGSADL
jgi:ABC-type sugar transport system ATPase subunit